jgi:hypothetical protein
MGHDQCLLVELNTECSRKHCFVVYDGNKIDSGRAAQTAVVDAEST